MDIWEKLQSVEQDYYAIEQLLRSAAMTLPDPIVIIDEFGKYIDVVGSPARSPLPGAENLVNKNVHEVLPEELADQFMQLISEAIAENDLRTIEYKLAPDDFKGLPLMAPKTTQWFEGRIYPIRERNQEIHAVILLTINITDRKNLEEQLQEMAERDPLTGALNRKHFIRIFGQEFTIAKRYHTNLSILHIDIDNLKDINGEFGHGGGDAVMKRFVIFCENNLRKSDLFARFDGKKFIAMLPNTPSLGAAIIAERIRASIEEMSVMYQKKAVEFTVSIGISQVQAGDTNSSAVLSRVESALYQAKRKGRNRIEIA